MESGEGNFSGSGGKVPVRLGNPHPSQIELPQRKALAAVSQGEPQEVQPPARLELRATGPQEVEVHVCRVEGTVEQPKRGAATTAEQVVNHPALKLQGDGLSPDEQRQLTAFLERWTSVFAAHNKDFGHTGAVYHQIPTGTEPPIREQYRPVPPKLFQSSGHYCRGCSIAGSSQKAQARGLHP